MPSLSRSLPRLLVVALLAGGCASPGPASERPVGASRDEVVTASTRVGGTSVRVISDEQRIDGLVLDTRDNLWARLPAVFEELGIEVTYVDPRVHAMGNRGFRVRRIDGKRPAAWLDCGMGPTARPYANEYEVTMGITVALVDVAEGTRAEVRVDAAAKPRDVSGASLPCRSTGDLERRLLTLLSP